MKFMISFFVLNNYKRRDWDLNPGGDHSTRFPVLRLTKLDYLGSCNFLILIIASIANFSFAIEFSTRLILNFLFNNYYLEKFN